MVVALIVYPGLLWTLLLSILIALPSRIRLPTPRLLADIRHSRYGLLALLSIVLAILAAVLTAWPLHPAARSPVGNVLCAWIVLEAAALLPLLPGFASALPLAVRAASREAQLGLAGRSIIWVAVVVASYAGSNLPGSLLAFVAGLLALPAATGLGPFGPEQSLEPDRLALGLDEPGVALLPFARLTRATVLLGLLASAAHPLWLFGAPVALVLILILAIGCGFILRWATMIPRLTLPAGLSWCWWQTLPLALAGLVYVIMT
jgi:hypothetical protein